MDPSEELVYIQHPDIQIDPEVEPAKVSRAALEEVWSEKGWTETSWTPPPEETEAAPVEEEVVS